MVIRRGDVTDIAWGFALLEMNCLITNQLETALIICHRLMNQKRSMYFLELLLIFFYKNAPQEFRTQCGNCNQYNNADDVMMI